MTTKLEALGVKYLDYNPVSDMLLCLFVDREIPTFVHYESGLLATVRSKSNEIVGFQIESFKSILLQSINLQC